MTKRKAIEAALSRWIKARNGFTAVDVEDVIVGEAVERAYNAGRIAGLRWAAKVVCHFDGWVPNGSLPTIRKHANKLAKKARAKK